LASAFPAITFGNSGYFAAARGHVPQSCKSLQSMPA
jgi:hypothetical protein